MHGKSQFNRLDLALKTSFPPSELKKHKRGLAVASEDAVGTDVYMSENAAEVNMWTSNVDTLSHVVNRRNDRFWFCSLY